MKINNKNKDKYITIKINTTKIDERFVDNLKKIDEVRLKLLDHEKLGIDDDDIIRCAKCGSSNINVEEHIVNAEIVRSFDINMPDDFKDEIIDFLSNHYTAKCNSCFSNANDDIHQAMSYYKV